MAGWKWSCPELRLRGKEEQRKQRTTVQLFLPPAHASLEQCQSDLAVCAWSLGPTLMFLHAAEAVGLVFSACRETWSVAFLLVLDWQESDSLLASSHPLEPFLNVSFGQLDYCEDSLNLRIFFDIRHM